jgi:hypothetical protein
MGDKLDAAHAKAFPVGSFVTYVNPADDPRDK